tara:strand:+ start:92 stop:334 length:243 start_codon:yes stop_codon:yes gene_type:complete
LCSVVFVFELVPNKQIRPKKIRKKRKKAALFFPVVFGGDRSRLGLVSLSENPVEGSAIGWNDAASARARRFFVSSFVLSG